MSIIIIPISYAKNILDIIMAHLHLTHTAVTPASNNII